MSVVDNAAEAIARLQRAAETLAADAQDAHGRPDETADAAQAKPSGASRFAADLEAAKAKNLQALNEWVAAAAAIRKARQAGAGLAAFAAFDRRKAAIAASAVIAVGASAWLGATHKPDQKPASVVAAREAAPPWQGGLEDVRSAQAKQAAEAQQLRREIHALNQEIQALRANAQKQAEEGRAALVNANSSTAKINDRLDKAERAASTRLDQQQARVERLERLNADPVVTSSTDKTGQTTHKKDASDQPLRAGADYVLRSVRNGVAVVQTQRGLIEVGPGDMIPGIGRVRSIEKVDGRWVVVTRDGVIDGD